MGIVPTGKKLGATGGLSATSKPVQCASDSTGIQLAEAEVDSREKKKKRLTTIQNLISLIRRGNKMFERKKIPDDSISPMLAAKWGRDVLDEGYVPFPKRLLRCLPAIFSGTKGMKELQAVLAIADYLRENLTRGPSTEFLSFMTGIEEPELKKLLARLKGRGLIDYKGAVEELTVTNEGLRKMICEKTTQVKKEHRTRDSEEIEG